MTALHVCPCVSSPLSPCFLEALGLQGRVGEPKLASPNVPQPHPGQVSSHVATSQVQVAHGYLALGSLRRQAGWGDAPSCCHTLSPFCALSQVGSHQGWVLPHHESGPRELGWHKGHPRKGY